MKFPDWLRPLAMLLSLILIWWGFNHLTEGAFLEARNLSNLFRQMSITGILASAMVLVIVMGQIDLSVGSLAALCGALLAVLDQYGLSASYNVLIVLFTGLLFGWLQGYLGSSPRIPSFIVTLGGMMVWRGLAMWTLNSSTVPLVSEGLSSFASYNTSIGLSMTLVGLVLMGFTLSHLWTDKVDRRVGTLVLNYFLVSFCAWIFTSYEGIPYPVLLMCVVAWSLHIFCTKSLWGLHIFAIGGNREAAFLSGINVKRCLRLGFVVTGLMSAVAGLVLTSRVGSASPDAGGLLELDAIAACVIGGTSLMGGRGSISGALLGALMIESLNNGMSLANMQPYWQYIIKGLVLVIAVGIDMSAQERKLFSE